MSLHTSHEQQFISVRRNVGKKPLANNILLEVDFPTPCPVQKYFYLIFCSEKRTHFRHLSSWGDMGQLLPWEGYLCESTGRRLQSYLQAKSLTLYLRVTPRRNICQFGGGLCHHCFHLRGKKVWIYCQCHCDGPRWSSIKK